VVRSGEPDLADPESEKVLLRIDQPYSNHNGGNLAFGPDGMLWIGTGEGGSASGLRKGRAVTRTGQLRLTRRARNRVSPVGGCNARPEVSRSEVAGRTSARRGPIGRWPLGPAPATPSAGPRGGVAT
jgi:hypothetical protein